MTAATYETVEDLKSIISNQIAESVSLEYKGSQILIARDISAICKAVSALANSAGGHFVIGIASQNGTPVGLDDGVPGQSRRDWIYKVVNAHTFPPVETLDITELAQESCTYYVLRVTPSPRAPHQSSDHKYYKRRGSHSEPMEHYEIEDIRSRPKKPNDPLRVELFVEGFLVHLHLRNDHDNENIRNLKCGITANFKATREGISGLRKRGIKQLRPQTELFFLLDSFHTILSEVPEAELTVQFMYEFGGSTLGNTVSFQLADYAHSSVMRQPLVQAVEGLGKKVDGIVNELRALRTEVQDLAAISDATGLRISHRTIAALNQESVLFDPSEFDRDGFMIVLNISASEATKLSSIFHSMMPSQEKQRLYDLLPYELRQAFEKRFNVQLAPATHA